MCIAAKMRAVSRRADSGGGPMAAALRGKRGIASPFGGLLVATSARRSRSSTDDRRGEAPAVPPIASCEASGADARLRKAMRGKTDRWRVGCAECTDDDDDDRLSELRAAELRVRVEPGAYATRGEASAASARRFGW